MSSVGTPLEPARGTTHLNVLLVLFAASGAAALMYQVLWVRALGLLVGSTAQAAAVAIAIFFAGVAAGSWFWGRRAAVTARPLAAFGVLEIAVAATALGHMLLLDIVARLPAALHPLSGAPAAVDLIAKIAVATVILLPPALLMGGTLPMMAEHVVRARRRLGAKATVLYAANTFGAAIGAVSAGFLLPPLLGYRDTYFVAIGLDVAVGMIALMLARAHSAPARVSEPAPTPASVDLGGPAPSSRLAAASPTPSLPWLGRPTVWAIAFASGVTALAIEVLWTRLFSQVLQNSVQTYALVLATFLVALSIGGLVASALCRIRTQRPEHLLVIVLFASVVVVAASGPVFSWVTDGMRTIGPGLGWSAYLASVGTATMAVMFVPGMVIGTVLPYLLRLLERDRGSPGELVGRLVAANTCGAIIGALVAAFVALPLLGTARSLLVCAAIYLALAATVLWRTHRASNLVRPTGSSDHRTADRPRPTVSRLHPTAAVLTAVMAVALVTTTMTGAPVPGLGDTLAAGAAPRTGETVVAWRDGPAAAVTVVEHDGHLSLRVNRTYTLGGTRSVDAERDQVVLPMLLHPDARRVFTLGMGTGITAGATLSFPVEDLVVCELIGDVISLARDHFAPWTGGLFSDPRATIVTDDGRSCLQRSERRYDVIVSDLFVPWHAGTGTLYTRELYQAAHARLDPGGLFVQWIPLYQIGYDELAVIAATMDDVFEDVVALRGDLFSSRSIIALVGSVDAGISLDPDVIARRAAQLDVGPTRAAEDYVSMVARMYVGNVTHSGLFAAAPVDTDSDGLVELRAPRTQRQVAAGLASFVIGAERERLFTNLAAALPFAQDPALRLFDDDALGFVEAGRLLSQAAYTRAHGREPDAVALTDQAEALLPAGTWHIASPSRALMAPLPAPVRPSP